MARMSAGSNPIGAMTRTKTTPIDVVRSTRALDIRCLTSMPVGKVVPVCVFGLLREDQVNSSRLRLNFEMLETVEILMNAVNVNVKAYLVPNLAFDRFNGIDQLNRSYEGVPEDEGGTVTPYFTTVAFKEASMPVLTYMGKHAREDQLINSAYIEAYNVIWNYRAANRSPDITPRLVTDGTLAKAFWSHQAFSYIVPDFDQAIIDGEVPLNVVDSRMPLHGIGRVGTNQPATANVSASQPAGITPGAFPYSSRVTGTAPVAGEMGLQMKMTGANTGVPDVWTELAANGITVSLSNIELARKTQAFASLRRQYTGLSDDYIIDLLMNGISVPEQAWREPMLLADRTTIFGMSKRYSASADDLTASVVNGATFIDIPMVTPRVPTGGVVMVTCEVTPEQLFERRQDPYLFMDAIADLPEFLRDTLDPEKVQVVENQFIDVDHDTPTATFGYAPLNHAWNALPPQIGGKFYRPQVDGAFDEDRQRIWAVETKNPTLSEDFYLCTDMHQKPFVVTDQDNFEVVMRGTIAIAGNTVFGNLLVEATDDYEAIMAQAPQDRIDKPAADLSEAEAQAERDAVDVASGGSPE